MSAPGTLVTIEGAAKPAPDPRARECHLLAGRERTDGGRMVALCGYDCTGRKAHSRAICVIEGHARCFECARLDGGGVDRFLRDVLDDRPF